MTLRRTWIARGVVIVALAVGFLGVASPSSAHHEDVNILRCKMLKASDPFERLGEHPAYCSTVEDSDESIRLRPDHSQHFWCRFVC